MSELKPCPFCGGDADWYISTADAMISLLGEPSENNFIQCDGECGANTAIYKTKEQAIKAWNTRAKED